MKIQFASETELSLHARKAIEACGIPTERLQSGTARGGRQRLCKTGCPDILTPLGLLEAKLPGEEPSDAQLAWHKLWRSHGARVRTFTTVEEAMRIVLEWRHEAVKQELPHCERCKEQRATPWRLATKNGILRICSPCKEGFGV